MDRWEGRVAGRKGGGEKKSRCRCCTFKLDTAIQTAIFLKYCPQKGKKEKKREATPRVNISISYEVMKDRTCREDNPKLPPFLNREPEREERERERERR